MMIDMIVIEITYIPHIPVFSDNIDLLTCVFCGAVWHDVRIFIIRDRIQIYICIIIIIYII